MARITSLPQHHVLTYAVLTLVILLTVLNSYHNLLTCSSANTSGINAAGISNSDILIVLQNGTVYKTHVSFFRAFSTLTANESLIIVLGTFKEHPALLALFTDRTYHTILYYVPAYTGALFSGVVYEGSRVMGVGYITFNDTYAGIVMHVNLEDRNATASVYVFSIPTYFRDVIIHDGEILVATGVGFSGKYYPAVTSISGSNARLAALNPSVGGLKGFAVKAMIILQGNEPAVMAMREEKIVLIQLTGGELRTYTLPTERRFEDIVLVTHPNGVTTTVILNSTAPAVITFPYMNTTLLPLASRYYLVTTNGSILALGAKYRILPIRWKSSRTTLENLNLKGFSVVEYTAKGKPVSVSTSEASITIETIRPSIPGTPTTVHSLTSLNTTTTTGFTLVGSGEKRGLPLIIIGCVLVFASFLLKRFLGV